MLLFLVRLLSRVPLRWMHRWGYAIGWSVYWFSSGYGKRMKNNLSASGICNDTTSFRRLLRAAIVQNGQALTELPAVWFRDDEAAARLVVECCGWNLVESARYQGRSIIFLSPHMGCFEIAARYVATHFPLTVMYRPQSSQWLNRLMENGRKDHVDLHRRRTGYRREVRAHARRLPVSAAHGVSQRSSVRGATFFCSDCSSNNIVRESGARDFRLPH